MADPDQDDSRKTFQVSIFLFFVMTTTIEFKNHLFRAGLELHQEKFSFFECKQNSESFVKHSVGTSLLQ